MSAALLPANSTDLERALADTMACATNLNVPLRSLWNADQIRADLLPYLAWAYSVEEEWEFAETEAERRALVASSVELHRYKGTPYAVRRGLQSLGFRDAEIHEGEQVLRHDGSFLRSGGDTYNAGARWALFSVTLDLGNSKGFDERIAARVRRAIDIWKNARSHLHRIELRVSLSEARQSAAEARLMVHIGLRLRDYREGLRDGTHRRARPTRYLRDGAWLYDASAPRAGVAEWSGLRFGTPASASAVGVHLALASARQPAVPRDGSIRFDSRLARDYRGALDPAPAMTRTVMDDARSAWPEIPGFLLLADPGAWATGAPLDGPLYGTATRQHPRDGSLLRAGAQRFGPDETTYYVQQGQTVYQTVWDYDQTQWDHDTTEWDE